MYVCVCVCVYVFMYYKNTPTSRTGQQHRDRAGQHLHVGHEEEAGQGGGQSLGQQGKSSI